jgi:hypothetical protein
MPKRCPPGVICIENITIVMLVVLLGIIILFINYKSREITTSSHIKKNDIPISMFNLSSLFARPNYSYSNMPADVLMNPYEPPLRDDRYFRMPPFGGRGVPINIPTQSIDTSYRQVGLLTRMNGAETILPLMGKPLFSNRDKWNFYTMSDKNTMVKLPVTNKGRSCTNEYGCDNLYNGDSVYVEGYNDAFKVTIYDNQVMRYLPTIF